MKLDGEGCLNTHALYVASPDIMTCISSVWSLIYSLSIIHYNSSTPHPTHTYIHAHTNMQTQISMSYTYIYRHTYLSLTSTHTNAQTQISTHIHMHISLPLQHKYQEKFCACTTVYIIRAHLISQLYTSPKHYTYATSQ